MHLKHSSTHLTYCLNVHPGEAWADQLRAIEQSVLPLKKQLSPKDPFGLGLRLGAVAARELAAPQTLEAFRRLLRDHNLYVFTVNGFPYGPFHGTAVKQNVYRPDWTSPERLAYTCRLADLLAALLPEGVPGSISTVPVAYRSDAPINLEPAIQHVTRAAQHLHMLHEKTGRLIQLALEPEPDCLLESTADCIAFFDRIPSDDVTRKHLGVCFDTCHFAVGFEDLNTRLQQLRKAGIEIPKLQISAALKTDSTHAEQLRPFCDTVYLHQTRIRRNNTTIIRYPDLPDALSLEPLNGLSEWRTHFHVPLYFEHHNHLHSTADLLSPDFFRLALESEIRHFEMETYTMTVLPNAMRTTTLAESIYREYQWTLERINP